MQEQESDINETRQSRADKDEIRNCCLLKMAVKDNHGTHLQTRLGFATGEKMRTNGDQVPDGPCSSVHL